MAAEKGELDQALVVQREKFIAKFGRELGPDDPIFFDMDEDAIRESTVPRSPISKSLDKG